MPQDVKEVIHALIQRLYVDRFVEYTALVRWKCSNLYAEKSAVEFRDALRLAHGEASECFASAHFEPGDLRLFLVHDARGRSFIPDDVREFVSQCLSGLLGVVKGMRENKCVVTSVMPPLMKPVETPIKTPVETPVHTPVETPVVAPTE